MITPDHDRGFQLARLDHLVEHQARAVPIPQPDPADAGGQALKRDALGSHVQPAVQVIIVGEQLFHRGIGFEDILGVARQRHPAKRPDAFAEQGPDIGGHKAGKGKGGFQPFFLRDLPDVVAIIQRRHARVPEIHHRRHMGAHRGAGGLLHRLWVSFLFGAPVGHAPPLRQIAVQRVMGRCLVGDDIGATVWNRAAGVHPAHQFGEHIGGIAQKAHRLCVTLRGPVGDHRQRLVQRLRFGIDVAGAKTEIYAGLVTLHRKAAGAGHNRRKRLCAAHAAKATRQDPFAFQRPAKVLTARLGKRLVGALHDALCADVNP